MHPSTLNSPVKRRNPRASIVDTRGLYIQFINYAIYLSLQMKISQSPHLFLTEEIDTVL